MSAINIPLPKPSRCVLLLSDDSVAVYDVKSSGVRLVDTVPWETEGFEEAVAQLIVRECKSHSVLILNDMVEQHYRKERVPRVGVIDKGNVIKRRLVNAFQSYPFRAALKLKEKMAPRQQADGGKVLSEDLYLFAAAPISDHVTKILGAISRTHASISSFSLLPVESSSLVYALSKKMERGAQAKSIWTVFVGQHQSGGLRQIVTKNGELALTRTTPISDYGSGAWAMEVVGELRGTMSYLSRFGYHPNDGLDVIIISDHAAADDIAEKVDFDCNLTILTAAEAASGVGLRLGNSFEFQHYADVLHVAWAGMKTLPAMSLQSPFIDKIAMPARRAGQVMMALLLGCAYFGYVAFTENGQWNQSKTRLASATSQFSKVQQEHADELGRRDALGIGYILIENSVKSHALHAAQAMYPLRAFDVIGQSLDKNMTLSALMVRKTPDEEGGVVAPPENDPLAPPRQKYDIVLRIYISNDTMPDTAARTIQDYANRMKERLAGSQIDIVKQVGDMSYTGYFLAPNNQTRARNATDQFEAQIRIRGILQ